MKKWLARSVCRGAVFRWGVRAIDALPDRRSDLLRVLTYHRVDEIGRRPDLDPFLISATPEQFAAQVQWLSRDYELVSLADVLASVHGDEALPRRALLLTFDDAYRDFGENAWPVLHERSAPAAIFVPTSFPDGGPAFWWDRLYGAVKHAEPGSRLQTCFGTVMLQGPDHKDRYFRQLKQRLKVLPQYDLQQEVDSICQQADAPRPEPAVMSWDQLQRLAKEGVALVPHTHTHPLLDRIDLNLVREEVRRSRDVLAEKLGGRVPPVFAYPSGHYNENVTRVVREEGIELAFTTIRGASDLRASDPLRIRRTNVGRNSSDAWIRLQLAAATQRLNRPVPRVFPNRPRRAPGESTLAPLGRHSRPLKQRPTKSTASS